MRALGLYYADLALQTASGSVAFAERGSDSSEPTFSDERDAAWRDWARRDASVDIAGEGDRGIVLPVLRPTRRGPWLPRLLNGGRTAGA